MEVISIYDGEVGKDLELITDSDLKETVQAICVEILQAKTLSELRRDKLTHSYQWLGCANISGSEYDIIHRIFSRTAGIAISSLVKSIAGSYTSEELGLANE